MPPEAKDLVVTLNLYILQTIVDIARNRGIAEAELTFGIERDLVVRLYNLSLPSLSEIASSPAFLFSVNGEAIRNAVKDRHDGQGYRSMHHEIARLSAMTRGKVGVL